MRDLFFSIRFLMISGFAVLAIAIFGQAYVFELFVQRERAGLERLHEAQQDYVKLDNVGRHFVRYQVALVSKDSTGEQISEARRLFDQHLAVYAPLDLERAQALRARIASYVEKAGRLREASLGSDPAALATATIALREAVLAVNEQLRSAFDQVDSRYKQSLDGEIEQQQRWEQGFRLLVAITILLLSAYALLILRNIIRPLSTTVAGIRALRLGNVLPPMPQKAEFGQITRVLRELRAATSRVRELAYVDGLTGLGSPARFEHALAEEIETERQGGSPGLGVGVMLLELHQLSTIISAHGPAVGQRCLKAAAQILNTLLSPAQTPSRYGDVRLIYLIGAESASPAAILSQAESLLEALREPIQIEGLQLRLEARAGFAHYPEDGADAAALLAAAESALSAAGLDIHDRIACYDPGIAEGFRRDLALVQEITHAIAGREFVPYYQPVVNIETNLVAGLETLVRWHHPRRGLVLPADFIPLAETTGQIGAIDAFVMEQAFDQLATWRRAGLTCFLGVNMSAVNCTQQGVAQIRYALQAEGLRGSDLVIELTETAVLSSTEDAHAAVRGLHALGAAICLDDFGTGYSSFSYLLQLPISRLKVDRSFVAQIGLSAAAERIIEATLMMAANLNVEVIAEGVETIEQMHWLFVRGCVRQQGWLYSRALPAASIAGWLERAPQLLQDLQQQLQATTGY